MKLFFKFILIVIIIINIIAIIPPFLNFMETQDDILCIKSDNLTQETLIESINQEQKIETEEQVNTQVIVQEKQINKEPIKENTQIEENQTTEVVQPIQEPVLPQTLVQNQIEETTSNRSSQPREEWLQFTATGYCPCQKCCGKTNGITASGARATAGVTVAMPSGYSFGTKIQLKSTNGNLMNGGNCYIVQDRGGAIKSNRIDIFFSTHQEALNFGRKTVYLKVVN